MNKIKLLLMYLYDTTYFTVSLSSGLYLTFLSFYLSRKKAYFNLPVEFTVLQIVISVDRLQLILLGMWFEYNFDRQCFIIHWLDKMLYQWQNIKWRS